MLTAPHLVTATFIAAIAAGTNDGPNVATVAAYLSLAVALVPVLVVGAAVVVLVWHGLRGTDPGPAGRMLLTLVRLVLRRPPRA